MSYWKQNKVLRTEAKVRKPGPLRDVFTRSMEARESVMNADTRDTVMLQSTKKTSLDIDNPTVAQLNEYSDKKPLSTFNGIEGESSVRRWAWLDCAFVTILSVKMLYLFFGIRASAADHSRLHDMLYPYAVRSITHEIRQQILLSGEAAT